MDYSLHVLPIPLEEYELPRWIKLEAKIASKVASGAGYGVADRIDVEGKTGAEYLKAMMAGAAPTAQIAQTLSFHLLEVKSGYVLYQGTPLDAHLNPSGTIHGGWIATLLEAALEGAVQSMLPEGQAFTTMDLNVKYVRALKPDVSRVRAEGKIVHSGRQMATAEARLYDASGTMYAHATCTCLISPSPP